MTRRLAVLYALTASVVLVATSVIPYWWFSRRMTEEDARALEGRIEELQGMLGQPGGVGAVAAELRRENVAMGPGRFVARIIAPDGSTAVESPDMPPALVPAAFSRPAAPGARWQSTWRAGDGTTYLLMSGLTGPSGADQPRAPWLVQVALDRTHESAVAREDRDGLLVAIAVGLLALSATGFFVARRALRPLAELTLATGRIRASQLGDRLGERTDGRVWPAELAELRTAFDDMLARLEDSFRRLQQFSADLAHELRTPMAKLRGEAEVALTRDRTPAEYRDVLASALEEYDHLSGMIDALLFLARADSGRAGLTLRPVSLGDEAAAAVEMYRPLADSSGVSLSVSGDAMVRADSGMVRHAVGNLLANALRYTPPAGSVQVIVEPVQTGAWVHVRDTGAGIASQHLPHVFDRFYRSDDARAPGSDGTGLGLALVKSIADLHGGHAEVASEVGRGTTVSMFFAAGADPSDHGT